MAASVRWTICGTSASRPWGAWSSRVGDVARVELGELTRYGAVTQDGKGEAVEGLVIGLQGANAGELVKNVKAKLAEIRPRCRRA